MGNMALTLKELTLKAEKFARDAMANHWKGDELEEHMRKEAKSLGYKFEVFKKHVLHAFGDEYSNV